MPWFRSDPRAQSEEQDDWEVEEDEDEEHGNLDDEDAAAGIEDAVRHGVTHEEAPAEAEEEEPEEVRRPVLLRSSEMKHCRRRSGLSATGNR